MKEKPIENARSRHRRNQERGHDNLHSIDFVIPSYDEIYAGDKHAPNRALWTTFAWLHHRHPLASLIPSKPESEEGRWFYSSARNNATQDDQLDVQVRSRDKASTHTDPFGCDLVSQGQSLAWLAGLETDFQKCMR